MTFPKRTWLCTKELATYTGYSESFFEQLRCYGGGPPFYKIHHSVRYRIEDVEAWLEEHRSEPGRLA